MRLGHKIGLCVLVLIASFVMGTALYRIVNIPDARGDASVGANKASHRSSASAKMDDAFARSLVCDAGRGRVCEEEREDGGYAMGSA